MLEPQAAQRARCRAAAGAGRGAPPANRERRGSIRRERERRSIRLAYRNRFPKAVDRLERDWERMLAYHEFPTAHWKHLRTTNVVESPFATVRLRTSAAKRFKRVENATALIWKTLRVVEQHFSKLDAPPLCAEVFAGVAYRDGERVVTTTSKPSPENPKKAAA